MSHSPPIPVRSDSLRAYQPDPDNSSACDQDLIVDTASEENVSLEGLVEYEAPGYYQETFETLNSFLSSGELCDLEIKCGEKSIKCHRVIVASISGYFKAMFTGDLAESKQSVVKIQDIDETVLEKLIKYAYSGKILLTVENVQSVLYASSVLLIDKVAIACSKFMKDHLTPENSIQVHSFAMMHNREQLIKYAEDFIIENITEVSKTTDFKTVNEGVIETILKSADLNVSSEIEAFELLMTWIKHDSASRKQHLPSLLSLIKLPLISTSYLMEEVAKNELIRNSLECRDYLDEAKLYQMYLGNLIPDAQINVRTRPRKSYAGVLFCLGGRGSSGDPYKTIECYHPMKNKWFQVTEMNTRRRHVGVCCLDGQIYAVGGHNGTKHLSTGEVFDPTTAKWRKIASMVTQKTGVRGLGLAALGGAVYAVGGLDDKSCFDTVERYDPNANVWTPVAPMIRSRGGVGVGVLKGLLYAIGGNDGTSSLSKCECYDPFINKWVNIPSMNCRRAGAGVGVLDGYIYVVGGFDDNNSLDTCERYDPRTQKWMSIKQLSSKRGGVGVASLGGKLYAVGGHDGMDYLKSVESYDPATNSWTLESPIEISRAGAGVVLLLGPVCLQADNAELNYFTSSSSAGTSWEALTEMSLQRAGAGLDACGITLKEFVNLCAKSNSCSEGATGVVHV